MLQVYGLILVQSLVHFCVASFGSILVHFWYSPEFVCAVVQLQGLGTSLRRTPRDVKRRAVGLDDWHLGGRGFDDLVRMSCDAERVERCVAWAAEHRVCGVGRSAARSRLHFTDSTTMRSDSVLRPRLPNSLLKYSACGSGSPNTRTRVFLMQASRSWLPPVKITSNSP